jgi:hypothetical protein
MLTEAATALLLVFRRPEDIPLAAALVGLALVGVVWLSTALLQVPRHSTLGSGFDHAAWSGLVLTNWVRTGENVDDDVNRVVPFEYSAKLTAALKLHGIDDPHTAWTVFTARAEALSDLRDQL